MQAHADPHARTKHADPHGHAGPEDFHQPPVLHGDHGHGSGHHDHTPALPFWVRVRSALARMWIGLYVPSIVAGLAKSFQWMVRPKTTELYPEVKPKLRKGYRGEHRLKKEVYNGEEREKCVACYMCATACPAECITIIAEEAPWPDRDKRPKVFEIDLLKCIYCGMCEEACPCDAIELTTVYTQVATSRKEKIYDKERLLRN